MKSRGLYIFFPKMKFLLNKLTIGFSSCQHDQNEPYRQGIEKVYYLTALEPAFNCYKLLSL